MPRIFVNGIETYYEVIGKGLPVIFMAGGTGGTVINPGIFASARDILRDRLLRLDKAEKISNRPGDFLTNGI
jgi:hypothetical protein